MWFDPHMVVNQFMTKIFMFCFSFLEMWYVSSFLWIESHDLSHNLNHNMNNSIIFSKRFNSFKINESSHLWLFNWFCAIFEAYIKGFIVICFLTYIKINRAISRKNHHFSKKTSSCAWRLIHLVSVILFYKEFN